MPLRWLTPIMTPLTPSVSAARTMPSTALCEIVHTGISVTPSLSAALTALRSASTPSA